MESYIRKGQSYGLTDAGALIYFPFPLTVFPSWCPPFPASPQPFHIPFCGVSDIYLCVLWLPHTLPAHRPRPLTPLPRSFSIMRRRFRTGLRRPREKQLREKAVNTAKAWAGCKESNGTHKKIIDLYNSVKPLRPVPLSPLWLLKSLSALPPLLR